MSTYQRSSSGCTIPFMAISTQSASVFACSRRNSSTISLHSYPLFVYLRLPYPQPASQTTSGYGPDWRWKSYSPISTKAPQRHVCRSSQQRGGARGCTADQYHDSYYAATIFENNIGLSGFLSRLLAALNGTEYFLASFIAIFTIERFGRRSLMLFGATGQAVSMAVLAGTTSHVNVGTGIAATVFLFVFNSFFAIGWLGMTW